MRNQTGNHYSNAAADRTYRSNVRGGQTGRAYRVQGNNALQPDIRRELEEAPRRQLSREARKNRDKAHHMSFGYVAFLAAALCLCAVVLIHYVQIQSEITAATKSISRLETQLNTQLLENEENYNQIVSSVDLEEIKKIAIGELGMTYATEGQIVTYSGDGQDYMRAAD